MERILVAIGEADDASSLATSAGLLANPGTKVEVVHVEESEQHLNGHTLAMVEEAVEHLRSGGAEAASLIGLAPARQIPERIHDEVARLNPDLVVMGSRRQGRIGAAVYGSVSHAVIERTGVAVLVVPREARPLQNLRRVLAAVGGQHDVEAVAEQLARLDVPMDVIVAHVPRLLAVHVATTSGSFIESPETSTTVSEAIRSSLRRLRVSGQVITLERSGGVTGAILRTARDHDVDLVVVGSRRLSDWESLLLGSVSHDLMRRSHLPVLVAARS